MQHHLQLLYYVHLSGISENDARDNAKKTKPKSSSGSAISARIPGNTSIREMLKHIKEPISKNSSDHRQVATVHGEIPIKRFEDRASEMKET